MSRVELTAAGRGVYGRLSAPWRFRIDGTTIAILPDMSRRTPVVDPVTD